MNLTDAIKNAVQRYNNKKRLKISGSLKPFADSLIDLLVPNTSKRIEERRRKLKMIPKKTPNGKPIRDELNDPSLRRPYYPSRKERNPIYEL